MAAEALAVLYAFDGKHVADLRALARTNVSDKIFLDEMPGPNELAASWVLKARAEIGTLSDHSKLSLFDSLPKLSEPDAVLHMLQIVQHASAAPAETIRPFLNHRRTLVRVWALDALARVAPGEAAPLIKAALEDTSAAMRARARALSLL